MHESVYPTNGSETFYHNTDMGEVSPTVDKTVLVHESVAKLKFHVVSLLIHKSLFKLTQIFSNMITCSKLQVFGYIYMGIKAICLCKSVQTYRLHGFLILT